MNSYISILRGINVSGQKIIKMDALCNAYKDLGFENVKTYIQSGNVIFQSDKSNQNEIGRIISKKIETQFGFEVPILIMNIQELKEIIRNNPFLNDKSMDISQLYVTFLSSKPEFDKFEVIKNGKYNGEQIEMINKAIYLFCPNGYGKTKLSNTFLENKLKVTATTRNWKTTLELLSIAERL